jgi:hypothetical protein
VELSDQGFRARWHGEQGGALWIGGRAQDFNDRASSLALQIRYRVDQSPSARVTLGMRCEAAYERMPAPAAAAAAAATTAAASAAAADPALLCGTAAGANIDVTPPLMAAPLGAWQTLVLPLACLRAKGADLAHVAAPFTLLSRGQFALSISDISLVAAQPDAACAP